MSRKGSGRYVESDLKFEDKVNKVVKKANKISGFLMRSITHKNRNIMVPLFKALLCLILEYGNVIWSPILKKRIN